MRTTETSEDINLDRRRLLGTAAMSIAVAGAASLLPAQSARRDRGRCNPPLPHQCSGRAARRPPPAHRGDTVAGQGNGHG